MMPRAASSGHRSAKSNVPVGVIRPSVLVVTEDEALATACRGTLEQAGYEVTCASHSGHALLECMQAVYFATPGTLLNTGNILVRPFSRDELVSRVRALVAS